MATVEAEQRVGGLWWPTWTLAERELVRFFRQRSRVIGALGQPLIFWLFFGAGLQGSFRPAGAESLTYGVYFFPGIVILIVLFSAIFATISVIEDRREGFLQGVLVAPVPRLAVVLGKVVGGTLLATLQAIAFLLLGAIVGVPMTPLGVALSLPFLLIAGVGLTSLGLAIAWSMDSTQGFHAVMSVFLMPLWLLSGAFFPAEGAPAWLAWAIRVNPVTYQVAGLRQLLTLGEPAELGSLPGLPLCLAVTALAAVAMLGTTTWLVRRSAK